MAKKPTYEELEQRVKEFEDEASARKKAEEALRESDERYTALFDRSLDCIYIHDFEGNFIDANPAALKLFGYTKEEILSLNFASLLSQDQMSLALQALEETKKDGFQKDATEFKLRTRNGEHLYIETKASVLYHEGEPYAIQGIGRDTTDRKRSEEALRESEERARQYLDIAGVGLVALDNEGTITLINKRGLEILGYQREELLGKNWFKTCLPDRFQKDVLAVYHQLIRGEVEPVEYYENPVLTKDGKERIIAWHNSVLRNPDGEIVGSLSSGEDITDRLLADEALRETTAKFKSIYDQSPIGVELYDSKGNLIDANPKCLEIFGIRDVSAVRGFKLFEDPNVSDEVKKRLLAGESVSYESEFDFDKVRELELYETSRTGKMFVEVFITPWKTGASDEANFLIHVMDTTERKWAEEELVKSDKRYKEAQSLAHIGHWHYEPHEDSLTWSDELYSIFEIDKDAGPISIEVVIERIHPEDRDTIRGQVEKGEDYRSEYRIVMDNGSVKHIREEVLIVRQEDGKILLMKGTAQDITKQKQNEEALKKSEQELELTLDATTDGIWSWNFENGQLNFSNKYYEMLGYTAGEFEATYENWVNLIHPEDRESALAVAENYFKTKPDTYENEFRLRTKSGNYRWIHAKATVVKRGPGGNALYMIGNHEDITSRKQAEQALRESEEKYRSMMEAMKDPVYICSPDFRVEYMNPVMIRRTGRDATGENCFKALHDLDEKCPWCMHDKVQKGKSFESEIVSPKDNRSYHVSQSSIVHEDGSISKMTVFRDTTDMRTLETQLQQAQKMEAIGTLAGGIAHDFNNILGGILGYAELAKMKAPEESYVIADLDKLIQSSKRAADLIKQILTISRHHQQEQRPVQARYIVNEALNLLRASLPTTIEIREDLAKDTGIVNADPTQIHQVIMNLGTNAGHAMQEGGGVLEVSLANVELDDLSASKHLDLTAGSYLRLTVSDTGHGMAPEIMERIFDPYFTTKDTGEGTGLGLSVAQGIVKAHGGTITVYSELGKGTAFHVYLPVILEEEREEKESEEPLPTGSERILFIDDEEILVEIGSQMLEQLRYEVVTKKSSIEALELFRAEPDRFDLVITDMTMPDMTGDKLARELMKIRPNIPIILCTGHNRLVSEEKAKEIGIKAFLMKPLVMRNLAETVRKVLDAGRSEV